VPQQRGADFINLIAISDVMLDATHFRDFNSNLERFTADTPVVSLPVGSMRSHHTMSFYNKMNIKGCITFSPEEYVEIAI
jgi:predicted O-linked N-acetylglucosamine transferase (SPINDLY family)